MPVRSYIVIVDGGWLVMDALTLNLRENIIDGIAIGGLNILNRMNLVFYSEWRFVAYFLDGKLIKDI